MARNSDKKSTCATNNDVQRDLRLVERFASGDGSAFDAIVEGHSGDVRALTDRLLGYNGDTEDVVQDVFLSAFLGLKKFKGNSSLRTWLYSITINKCRGHRRKRMVRFRFFSGTCEDKTDAAAESQPMTREEFDSVGAAVRSLPLKYREVVVLRYLEELPIEKVCEILNVSSNVAHVRLNRARAKLKDKLINLMDE